MNTVTHALAPVLLARVLVGPGRVPGWRGWVAIALAGAMPDLVDPHLSLEARVSSWSHGLPAWLGFSACFLLASRFRALGIGPRVAWWMGGAYGLHLVCDAIAGGIGWLRPFDDRLVGGYLVDPRWWPWIDGLLLFSAWLAFRVFPPRGKIPSHPENRPIGTFQTPRNPRNPNP